jgi:DNA-binding transcriptional ArsR family regulator
MKKLDPACNPGDHPQIRRSESDPRALDRASRLFRALGDAPRLRLLEYLMQGECCVTELVQELGEKFPTISQRLRLLRSENLIVRRRAGTHLYYALADQHVMDLIQNALAHAAESGSVAEPTTLTGAKKMNHTHADHDHQHGTNCGHTAVKHGDHVDYLHDGHLHHPNSGTIEEHALDVNAKNPDACTPAHTCAGHTQNHVHGAGCGHEAVPHGDHVDYLVDGHLHHPHGNHCDNHGPVDVVK